jgi:hypothetical protein
VGETGQGTRGAQDQEGDRQLAGREKTRRKRKTITETGNWKGKRELVLLQMEKSKRRNTEKERKGNKE